MHLNRTIGVDDVLIEKSRDMGASIICLSVFEWRWHFKDLQTFLMVSRTEPLVDKKNEPDALFWKIDFIIEKQPKWLVPNFDRQKLSLENEDNKSTITGASTTAESGRGGRKTAILLDEFAAVAEGEAMLASTRDATNSRFLNSTPKGAFGAFYDMRNKLPANQKLRLHWTLHPEKSIGLYRDSNGKPRSPWYDKQCARAASLQEIAQELDIDYLGSGWQFFDQSLIDELILRCQPASSRGDLDVENGTLKPTWNASGNGAWELWCKLDLHGKPPSDRNYVIAIDVAMGSGSEHSSNSALVVYDRKTSEKVAQLVSATIKPADLAALAVSACKWFKGPRGDAFLIWEDNGPAGSQFRQWLIANTDFRNFYYRKSQEFTGKAARSKVPGWWTSDDNKPALLGAYATAMKTGAMTNRSEQAIKECSEFIHEPGGKIVHQKSRRKGNHLDDPTATGAAHGDVVMADAMAWHALKEESLATVETKNEPPLNSPYWRNKEYDEAEQAEKAEVW